MQAVDFIFYIYPHWLTAARSSRISHESRLPQSLRLIEVWTAYSRSLSCGRKWLTTVHQLKLFWRREHRCLPKRGGPLFFHGSPLSAAATRILNIVSSSAAVERINSTQLRTHSKERNRLTHERVEKLVKVAVNRRIESGRKRQQKDEEEDEDQSVIDTLWRMTCWIVICFYFCD